MKRVMIIDALGQIGIELVVKCGEIYGTDDVLATDIREPKVDSPIQNGPFEILDVTNRDHMFELARDFEADSLMYMAALLSTTVEKSPTLAWDLNMGGLMNVLEATRTYSLYSFIPNSTGAFEDSTPKVDTPQVMIQQPTIMYGVNKVAGELSCQYYLKRFGVNTRSVRFPGLTSHIKEPGGGTIDYAVEIYFKAVREGYYTSFIDKGMYMDVIYMDDVIEAITKLVEADDIKLETRNGYNLSVMSFDPEIVKEAIQEYYLNFTLDYDVDPTRQSIANSWPDSVDTSCSCDEWGFNPRYDLASMAKLMLEVIEQKDIVKSNN